MRRRPLIGITTYGRNEQGAFYLPGDYVDAVRQAGGLPILLPPGEREPKEVVEVVEGLILAGGGDIDPSLYGALRHPTIERINPERDRFELSLAKLVLESERPVLGICRGMQMLNVATGGTLIQDVPGEVGRAIIHRGENRQSVDHSVSIEKKSRLAGILGTDRLEVKSLHHQGLQRIARAWRVVGRSEDGLVEAMEHEGHPWMICVLWHPELSVNDGTHRRLFSGLVEEARRRISEKTRRR